MPNTRSPYHICDRCAVSPCVCDRERGDDWLWRDDDSDLSVQQFLERLEEAPRPPDTAVVDRQIILQILRLAAIIWGVSASRVGPAADQIMRIRAGLGG